MRKKLLSLIASFGLLGLFLFPAQARAVDVISPACQQNPTATFCQSNTSEPTTGNSLYGPNGLLTRVAQLIAVVVGIASVIMIIIGGFKYITSSGDPSNVKSAKDTILFAIVGLLIAVCTQSIVLLVLRNL